MKKWKEKKKSKRITFFFLMFFYPLLHNTMTVFADIDEETCQNILLNYKKYFVQNDLIHNGFRYLQWGIIKGLKWVADSCQTLYSNTLGLMDFTSYSGFTDFTPTLKGIFTAIMAVSIMMLGIILIVNHKKKPDVLVGVLLAALTISALGELMITANEGVQSFCNEMVGSSMADSVVNDNLFDLRYIDSTYGIATFSDDAETLATYHAPLEDFYMDAIDINEVINYDDPYISSDASTLLKKSYQRLPDGTMVDKGVYNGWGWNSGDDDDLFNDFYYRYKINAFPICVSLIAIIIVFLVVSYKSVRLSFELAIKKVITILYSADITGSQKTLKLLGSIKNTYIIFMVNAITLKLFIIFQSYLSEKFSNNGFTYCIILLFTSLAVIDGPNIVQELTGEDAGLQSSASRILAIYNAGRGRVRGAGSAVSGGVRSAVGYHRYKSMKDALGGDKKNAKDAATKNIGGSLEDGQAENQKMKEDMQNSPEMQKEESGLRQGMGETENEPQKENGEHLSSASEANEEMKEAMSGGTGTIDGTGTPEQSIGGETPEGGNGDIPANPEISEAQPAAPNLETGSIPEEGIQGAGNGDIAEAMNGNGDIPTTPVTPATFTGKAKPEIEPAKPDIREASPSTPAAPKNKPKNPTAKRKRKVPAAQSKPKNPVELEQQEQLNKEERLK